jgi:hypothetical protein
MPTTAAAAANLNVLLPIQQGIQDVPLLSQYAHFCACVAK